MIDWNFAQFVQIFKNGMIIPFSQSMLPPFVLELSFVSMLVQQSCAMKPADLVMVLNCLSRVIPLREIGMRLLTQIDTAV